MFIKSNLYEIYDINVTDKACEGIIAIKFTAIISQFSFVVVCAYLPPENSAWGRDASEFYSHILHLIYLYNNVDAYVLCGDFNSRFGDKQETNIDIDNLPRRLILDKSKNMHGDCLFEFLVDGKMCIINGRLNPLSDNFTSVTTKGKSVVDYFIVPHDTFDLCHNFSVTNCETVVNDLDLMHMLNNRCKVPDHSILTMELVVENVAVQETIQYLDYTNNVQINNTDGSPTRKRKYVLNCIPDNFLDSVTVRGAVEILVQRCIDRIESQQNIDVLYDDTCAIFKQEMDNVLPYKDVSSREKNKFKAHKVYWNEELKTYWCDMIQKRKQFEQFQGDRQRKRALLNLYKTSRRCFDRKLRFYERQYNRNKLLDLENMCVDTKNPKKFWDNIKKLGPRGNQKIPMAVYNESNEIVTEEKYVTDKWKEDFSKLYNGPDRSNFDQDFYREAMSEKSQMEDGMRDGGNVRNDHINREFSIEEVSRVVHNLKKNKAVGIDRIPNEVLQSQTAIMLQKELFNACFSSGLTPSCWKQAIIFPIPKSTTNDPKIPINYRGISLLSCISKVYTSLLNERMVKHFEKNNILVDEQNGFRKKRSCMDHTFSISSIIKNRMQENKSTFTAFLDLKKAFDYVNRDLLYYKLLLANIDGNMYTSIKTLYNNTEACIQLNNNFTSWFPTSSGVRQGDSLSPSLFALFINDMAIEVKNLNRGVSFGDLNVSIFLYADDIVILAENEYDLQVQLDCIDNWCRKWQLLVNGTKSQIVHFRKKGIKRSTTEFKLGSEKLLYTNSYKYLGVIFDEHLTFENASSVFADSAGRALGSISSKVKSMKNVGYGTFTKLYNSGVKPILNYCSGVWGFQNWKSLQKIQNRAIRFYLGVHKFVSTPGLHGEMGWYDCEVDVKLEMIRLWNRLVQMEPHRITQKIFLVDFRYKYNNWCNNVYSVLHSIDMVENFDSMIVCNLSVVRSKLQNLFEEKWKHNIHSQLKLRTYKMFKDKFETENYIMINLERNERSLLAQLRLGILPLRIETGRFIRENVENRTCYFCKELVEDEVHFILFCEKYNYFRTVLFQSAMVKNADFHNMAIFEKLKYLFQDCPRQMAKYVHCSFNSRTDTIFSK